MNVLTTIENIRDPRSFETMVSDIKNELSGEFEAMSQRSLQQLKDFYVQSTETEVDLYNSAIEITER
jgi:thiaminase